jgi:UDP-glucuronate 4-epimerase
MYIVEGVVRVLADAPDIDPNWESDQPNPATSGIAKYRLYNIGNNAPVELMHCVEILEKRLGKKSVKNYMPMQPGDVKASWADSDNLAKNLSYTPVTSMADGLNNFVEWYLDYFEIKI